MAWSQHPSSRRATLPPDWYTRVRPAVLRRDGYRCQIQGPRCVTTANQVDHVDDPHDHRLQNLRAGCEPCHHDRSAQQGGSASGTARRARTAARKRPQESHPGLIS
jgi:5-methylcytosine-specific restriction endonuclease McrA